MVTLGDSIVRRISTRVCAGATRAPSCSTVTSHRRERTATSRSVPSANVSSLRALTLTLHRISRVLREGALFAANDTPFSSDSLWQTIFMGQPSLASCGMNMKRIM